MSEHTINTGIDGELLDDQLLEATRRVTEAKLRVLALALARGYDGVDLILGAPNLRRGDDYRQGFDWEVWEGEPEPLEPYTSRTQRYDFRALDECERRALLSHAGLSPEDIDND